MPAKSNPLIWIAVLFLAISLSRLVLMLTKGASPLDPFATVAAVAGCLLLVKQKWARLVALALIPCLVLFLAMDLLPAATLWSILLLAGGLAWLLTSAWFIWKHREPVREMISLVWFLAQPRQLELPILRQIVEDAWDVSLGDGEDEDESKGYVVGEEPLFMISASGGMFTLNCFPHPYLEDAAALAAETKNQRLAKILLEHRAWLSVDWFMFTDGVRDTDRAYDMIARLMAGLANDDCLGLFCPETSELVPHSPELLDHLRAGKPRDAFQECAQVPVVNIAEDDPRMLAAVAEAKRRWPEFIEAFRARQGENYAVKAPITSGGNTEFIWVEVDGVSGDVIFGKLGNDPIDLPGYKLGDPVEVELKDLNDWGYILNGEPVGMFTSKILLAQTRS